MPKVTLRTSELLVHVTDNNGLRAFGELVQLGLDTTGTDGRVVSASYCGRVLAMALCFQPVHG